MSDRTPVVSGKQLIVALERVGYEVTRQKGSHVRLRCPRDARRGPTIVPLHREFKTGARGILSDASLTTADLLDLLR